MKDHQFGNYENPWNENAKLWIDLVDKGFDLYRDHVSFPGFLKILPNISGLKGLDIGCAEGRNTRVLAQLGAKMTGIDICSEFIQHALMKESELAQGIEYFACCATSLPLPDQSFDFVTAFVSLIDIQDVEKAIQESFRVLKPGGFFQFSITHPCFWSGSMEWQYDEKGSKHAFVCNHYFDSDDKTKFEEWMFEGVDSSQIKNRPMFKSYKIRRSLSDWVNILSKTGYHIEEFAEPRPSTESLQKHPVIDGSNIIPYFLIIRCRKL